MRILIAILLVFFSCNKSEVATACTRIPVSQTVTGFFMLEDNYVFSSLNGPQTLETEDLTIGYSYGDAILWIESETYDYPLWRNHSIAIHGISTFGKLSFKNYHDNHTEIQLTEELNEWIYENQDSPIFFKLNLLI